MKLRAIFTLFVVFVLASCVSENKQTSPDGSAKSWAIAIHGGAGVIPKGIDPDIRDAYMASLTKALELGIRLLEEGKDGLDVVEQVIHVLEEDTLFNAGRGAVYTADAKHELDASIMDGRTLSAGAVTGITSVKHPISLARLVMTETSHVLLSGDGAEEFANMMDVERVENSYFDSSRRLDQLKRAQEQQSGIPDRIGFDDLKFGTVGVAVLDRSGNLAAGTSTGGMTNKKHGRVGDSPIIGAGTYASNLTCAISATGKGEEFIRHAVAFNISALMRYQGKSLKEAANEVIQNQLQAGDGGIIAVDRLGNIVMEFNSPGMFRAAGDSEGFSEVKIWE